jgi:SAM-dependent methyltransferase
MTFRTMPLAFKYCMGHGVELGAAAHNPFGLTDCLSVGPCDGVNSLYPEDMVDYEGYKDEQLRFGSTLAQVDMLGDFQNIPVDDGQFDYLISSHVIEHEPNLIAGFIESYRVLKNGAVFFCIFPKRAAVPVDAVKALTTLQEIIAAYENKIDMDTVAKTPWRTHYQVFSLQSMIRAINYINSTGLGNWLIECVEETDSKVGNGHTVVLRKMERLPALKLDDRERFDAIISDVVGKEDFTTALKIVKASLSYDFFDPVKLHIAALLCFKINDRYEGQEFLRQALAIDPENEMYRKDFYAQVGVVYTNSIL